MDRALEYSLNERKKLVQNYETNQFNDMQVMAFLEQAYRAGYSQGAVDATRRQTEPEIEPTRGIDLAQVRGL